MSATIVLALLLVMVFETSADRVKCQMVPLQSSEGLMGMCCVFVKNVSASDLRNSVVEDGAVHFPDDKKTGNTIAMPESKDKGIVFPGNNHHEHKKNHPDPNNIQSTEKSDNSTMIHFPNSENKNVTTNSTVDLANRNKNDAPDTCTDGKKKDLDGNCVDPF